MFTSHLYALFGALGFLTRLPLPSHCFSKEQSIYESAKAFSLVGAFIGFCGGSIFCIFTVFGFGALLSALLAVTTTIIITGALHEDGLSDVVDGFFSKNSAEERLIVMKDPHIGTFGTIALIASFGFHVFVIARLADYGIQVAFFAFIALESISRAFMVWFWGLLPLARKNGTAAAAGEPSLKIRNLALIDALILSLLFVFLPIALFPFILSLFLGALVAFGFAWLCSCKIHGYTGDTLGACQQLVWAGSAIGILVGCHISF